VVDRKDAASWLEGPGGPRKGGEQAYPGQRLGLPPEGAGSVATFQRRLGAVTIDWIACVLIARVFSPDPWLPLLIFFAENVVLVSTLQSTFGMRLLGVQVRRLDPTMVSPLRAALRAALLCLVIPATIWDRDGRGLHDKAAGTVVVSTR
jgi:uncharacterized RDD family membrane protein YckC